MSPNQDIQQKVDEILNYVISLTSSSDVNAKIFNKTLNQIKILSATSCKEVQEILPESSSGVYLFASPDGNGYRHVYCHMEELCGLEEGWTRLAYLNMSDPFEQCPSELRFYQSGGVRVCGRPFSGSAYFGSGSCASVKFPSNGLHYSQICGRVLGYQYGSPDGLHIRFNASKETNINSYYMDGISITRGSPRQHVWTLMAGLGDSYFNETYNCPCNTGSTVSVPSFVGNHYFCESGNSNPNYTQILYTSDPLWDGQGCGTLEGPCCSAPGLPWFYRDYGSNKTNDYIELRICSEESTNNEDTPVHFYELYVK
uniref:Fibrinogen C-terminal domain-containing protein n=1 Tax=Amphimedon queenslandica TaxID=400682 RepID=A0A1X7VVP2_AMPQE